MHIRLFIVRGGSFFDVDSDQEVPITEATTQAGMPKWSRPELDGTTVVVRGNAEGGWFSEAVLLGKLTPI